MNNIQNHLINLTRSFEELQTYCRVKMVTKPEPTEQEKVMLILSNDINEVAKSFYSLFNDQRNFGYYSFIRIAFEKYLYLLHINKSVSNAKAYFYHLFIHQMQYYDKFLKKDEYVEAFATLIEEDVDNTKKYILSEFDKGVKDFNDLEIVEKYKSCFNYQLQGEDTYFKNHKWYNFDNKTCNLKELSEKVGKKKEYLLIYEITSSEVHSKSLGKRYEIVVDNDRTELHFKQDVSELSELSISIMYKILSDTVTVYIAFFNPPKKYITEVLKYIL